MGCQDLSRRQEILVETIGTADDKGDPNGADILNFSQAQKLAR
jgi:hypothetical protein